MFRETINGLIHQINYYLKKYGINHQMNFNEFLILAVLLLVIGGFLEYYILSMCMNDNYEEEIKKQIELIEKNEKIKKSKNKKEKDEQENDDKKELNEEDKIKEEEKIEKQFKEKNENDKNNNKKEQKEKND